MASVWMSAILHVAPMVHPYAITTFKVKILAGLSDLNARAAPYFDVYSTSQLPIN
jgi:hypothetical protein